MERAFARLRLPQPEPRRTEPYSLSPWGRHGLGGWRQPAGNPACGVKSDPPAGLLPNLHRIIVFAAMPACDEMIKQGRVARALVQGCGRRPAASGTTAWARRRPGGGESARTSRPLTTPRFAATGLSPLPSSLLTLAALLRSHPIRGMEPLPRVSAAERFINLCAFVGTVVATCYPEQ